MQSVISQKIITRLVTLCYTFSVQVTSCIFCLSLYILLLFIIYIIIIYYIYLLSFIFLPQWKGSSQLQSITQCDPACHHVYFIVRTISHTIKIVCINVVQYLYLCLEFISSLNKAVRQKLMAKLVHLPSHNYTMNDRVLTGCAGFEPGTWPTQFLGMYSQRKFFG